MQKVYSEYLTLSQREWLKGLWLALIAAFVAFMYNVVKGVINTPDWQLSDLWAALTDYQPLVKALAGVAFVYWSGTGLTNSDGKFLKKESK